MACGRIPPAIAPTHLASPLCLCPNLLFLERPAHLLQHHLLKDPSPWVWPTCSSITFSGPDHVCKGPVAKKRPHSRVLGGHELGGNPAQATLLPPHVAALNNRCHFTSQHTGHSPPCSPSDGSCGKQRLLHGCGVHFSLSQCPPPPTKISHLLPPGAQSSKGLFPQVRWAHVGGWGLWAASSSTGVPGLPELSRTSGGRLLATEEAAHIYHSPRGSFTARPWPGRL